MSIVNAKACIKITHSRRGLQVLEKTWESLVWEWFGPKDSRIPAILEDLNSKGIASITDSSGTMTFVTKDKMYI